MFNKILLPTDGSEAAERAEEYAISLADVSGGDIIVLYDIDTSYLKTLAEKDTIDQVEQDMRKEGEEVVERFKKKFVESQFNGQCKNVNVISLIKKGKPVNVILKTAEEQKVELIAMGKSGKDCQEKLILGNITERVIREAKVPVHVIA